MPLATDDFFGLVDDTNPRGTDSRTISDDQHQNILKSLRKQCPNWTAAVNATHADVNTVTGMAAAGTKPLPGVGAQTVVYFYLATPPPGYTPADPDANVRNLTIGGAAGLIGGTDNPISQSVNATVTVNLPGSTGGHQLSINEMPGHDHDLFIPDTSYNLNVASIVQRMVGTNVNAAVLQVDGTNKIAPTGGGAAHSHSIGGTAAGSGTDTLTPRYAMGVLGRLNA